MLDAAGLIKKYRSAIARQGKPLSAPWFSVWIRSHAYLRPCGELIPCLSLADDRIHAAFLQGNVELDVRGHNKDASRAHCCNRGVGKPEPVEYRLIDKRPAGIANRS
jgi:hypothetical protein